MMNVLRVLLLCAFATVAQAQNLLPPEQAFEATARFVDDKRIEVRFDIAPGYYLYRDKLAFSAAAKNISLGDATIPRGEIKEDEFFGRVEIFRDSAVIVLPVLHKSTDAMPVSLNAQSQGCAEIGVCYPPLTETLKVRPAAR